MYALTALFLLVFSLFAVSAGADLQSVEFTVTNPGPTPVDTFARVALPVPQGLLAGELPQAASLGGPQVAAQARLITTHPDGSARRVMLTLPVSLQPGETVRGEYTPGAGAQAAPSMLQPGEPLRITTDAWTLTLVGDRLELTSPDGRPLGALQPFGPDLGGELAPALEVIEQGPQFVWLRLRTDGDEWGREVEVQANRRGELRLIHRLQHRGAGNRWTPGFGWQASLPGARPTEPRPAATHLMALDPQETFAQHPELIIPLTLADGAAVAVANPLALRQTRGTLAVESDEGGVRIRSDRTEPIEQPEDIPEEQDQRLMIQEGQYRVSELVMRPGAAPELAARLDAPVHAHASWEAYDAVYRTGPPLQLESEILRELVDKHVRALQGMSVNGDDWGNMTSWAPQQRRPAYNSQVRFNHAQYLWEEWFRGGDARLRRIALDWAENYHNLGMYWGPNEQYYGACRRGTAWRDRPGRPHGPGTYMVRFDNSQLFVHKGFANFYLAYEETGDPRFRLAAEKAAQWGITHQHAGLNYTRVVGCVSDFVKLYEYTGRPEYLAKADHLWETFQQVQGEDLLFTESGRPAVGNHLYLEFDAEGYRNPFVKPYIVQYATNALPDLLRHRPADERLRATIIALNDFMAESQSPGGGWGYPHPDTASLGWNIEYVHGLMLGYHVEPKEEYLKAIARDLRPKVQLLPLTGEIAAGINPWEFAAGINAEQRAERYHLATDRDRMRDFDEGRIRFGHSPDSLAYFFVVLRDYLMLRDEASLFESDDILERIKRLPTTLNPG